MTVTAASLRADFPEFRSISAFPNSSVNFWLNVASVLLNKSRWGNPSTGVSPAVPNTMYDIGMELFVAHNLTLEARNQAEAANGKPPGWSTGPITAKSVDKVSVNYSSADALHAGAAHWNLTNFGTRFVTLQNMVGAGPIYVGAGCMPTGAFSSFNAWAGPWVFNVPNPQE